jgi:hypothetical protein
MIPPMSFDPTQAAKEIERRNQLRAENHLPLINVEAELKRMQQVERETVFERFVDSSELYRRTMREGCRQFQLD